MLYPQITLRAIKDWAKSDTMTQDTGWQPITVSSGAAVNTGFPPKVRRIANVIYLQGSITLHGKTGDAFTLPVGYRPSADAHFDLPMQSGTTSEMVRVYVTAAGVGSVVATINIDKPFFLEPMSWPTDEPLPTI